MKYIFYCWGCRSKLQNGEVEVSPEEIRCLKCGSYAVDPIQIVVREVLEAESYG